jgi:hypothetical protein
MLLLLQRLHSVKWDGWVITNYEYVRIWKEVVGLACLKVLSQYMPRAAEEKHENSMDDQ